MNLSFNCFDRVLCDCPEAINLLKMIDDRINWRFRERISKTRSLIQRNPNLELKVIPRELNGVADALAMFGRRNPGASFFHKGLELLDLSILLYTLISIYQTIAHSELL